VSILRNVLLCATPQIDGYRNLLSAMRSNNNTQSYPDTVSDDEIKSPGATNDEKESEKKELSEVRRSISSLLVNDLTIPYRLTTYYPKSILINPLVI
jgi:hypothetical protein